MRIYKCDRCGKGPIRLNGSILFTQGWKMRDLDLCPDCLKSFKRWLNGKEEEQEGKRDVMGR